MIIYFVICYSYRIKKPKFCLIYCIYVRNKLVFIFIIIVIKHVLQQIIDILIIRVVSVPTSTQTINFTSQKSSGTYYYSVCRNVSLLIISLLTSIIEHLFKKIFMTKLYKSYIVYYKYETNLQLRRFL